MRQLLHLSDVHFGPPHRPEVMTAAWALIERRRPDLVVISGDLTQRAKPHQFQEARALCDRIESELGIPTLAVPGNHDVPMYRVWERVFAPYGAYRRHFATDLEPVFATDDLLVVGANSAFNWTIKDGRLTARQLRQMDRRLAAGRPEQTKIVVVHHPLVPPPRFDSFRVLGRAVELTAILARHRVDAVLTGHVHQAFVTTTECYYPSGRTPTLLINSGTSTSNRGRGCERGRCSANWLRIDARTLTVERLGYGDAEQAFVRWSEHRYPRPGAHDNLPTLGACS